MSSLFTGQIMPVAFNFPPERLGVLQRSFCDAAGINQNQAIFSLLGTTYGGNRQTTFQLPNLQSSSRCTPAGVTRLGETSGAESVTLNIS